MRSERLASVDAFRGLTVAGMLLVNNPGDWAHVFAPLRHADWHGCTPTDLVFPFFLFIVGVSLALSKKGTVPQVPDFAILQFPGGASPGNCNIAKSGTWWRGLRLIALGLALNLAVHFAFDAPHYRIAGVLQRIGVCVIVVGAIAVYTAPRAWWVMLAVLLAGYAALLAAGGTFAPEVNLASRVDTAVLGEHAYVYDASTGRGHDPEGLLSTLGALATTWLGLIAGELLRQRSLRGLLVLGVACLLLGAAWNLVLPLNKNLWTPSYALWSAGWAALVLLAMHFLIDRRGWPAIGRSLGMNAILVYAGSILLVCVLAALNVALYRPLFASWITPLFGENLASLAYGLAHVALWWLIAWLLHRRGRYYKL